MLATITLSLCVALSVFVAYVVHKNKLLVFSSSALLSLLPITYIVHGTSKVLSELTLEKFVGDVGVILVMLVQEPIKFCQHREDVQYPFALLGFAVFVGLVLGIGQVLFEKKRRVQIV